MQDVSSYCREIETYLCRKNEGHLIRIVGPAFELVCAWHERGVPLKIAFQGVDRYCERYYAKGPRRRPVRIEFCEADILELFDDWRRAVGVASSTVEETVRSRKPGLASHLQAVVERLLALRTREGMVAIAAEDIDRVVQELDRLADTARHARGEH